MSMKDPTVIKVDKTTRELLRSLGAKDESYDDVIKRLIANWTLNPPKVKPPNWAPPMPEVD